MRFPLAENAPSDKEGAPTQGAEVTVKGAWPGAGNCCSLSAPPPLGPGSQGKPPALSAFGVSFPICQVGVNS